MNNIPQEILDKIEENVPTGHGYKQWAVLGAKLRQSEIDSLEIRITSLLHQIKLRDDEVFKITDERNAALAQADSYKFHLTSANKRIECLEEALKSIAEAKYPESVFAPLTNDDIEVIKKVLAHDVYISLDRLSAHYGRIFQKIFSDVAKEALK